MKKLPVLSAIVAVSLSFSVGSASAETPSQEKSSSQEIAQCNDLADEASWSAYQLREAVDELELAKANPETGPEVIEELEKTVSTLTEQATAAEKALSTAEDQCNKAETTKTVSIILSIIGVLAALGFGGWFAFTEGLLP